MVSLCNKFENGLSDLKHVVFCDPDFVFIFVIPILFG